MNVSTLGSLVICGWAGLLSCKGQVPPAVPQKAVADDTNGFSSFDDAERGGNGVPTPPAPASPPTVQAIAFYPADCAEIKRVKPDAVSGMFKLYLNATSPDRVALDAYCDMKEDGGGWTLILNYSHLGNTNPPLTIMADKLPLLDEKSALGTDESASKTLWGHAGNALLKKFSFRELRFYCSSNDSNARIIHFRTSDPGCINAAQTGMGSCSEVALTSVLLSLHSGELPRSANANRSKANTADQMLTDNTFGRFNGMWSIRGGDNQARWECDFESNNSQQTSTLHRVFFR